MRKQEQLFYVKNVAFKNAYIFKRHTRFEVQDDSDMLKRLILQSKSDNQAKALEAKQALEFYENFYKELDSTSKHKNQRDILNNLGALKEEFQVTSNYDIYGLHDLNKKVTAKNKSDAAKVREAKKKGVVA